MRLLQNTLVRPVGGVSFGPGGRFLVAGGSGGYDVWDLASSSRSFLPSHAVKYLYGCVFDPLGRMWVASIGDPSTSPPTPGSVKIFDFTSPTPQTPVITILGINASQFAVIPSAVPEPGTMLLLGGAAVAGFIVRRRRK